MQYTLLAFLSLVPLLSQDTLSPTLRYDLKEKLGAEPRLQVRSLVAAADGSLWFLIAVLPTPRAA